MDQKSNLTATYEVQEVNISLGDSIIHDPLETSQTIQNLSRVGKISTETSVRTQHPDWNDEKVDEEVKRIMSEEGLQPVTETQIGG